MTGAPDVERMTTGEVGLGGASAHAWCAVVGDPVAHSLSPCLHNAGYAALGLTGWSMRRWQVGQGELGKALQGANGSLQGVAVTMPLKREAARYAAEVSCVAREIGVANTLTRTPRGWRADNTDAMGWLSLLRPWSQLRPHISLLGSGATAMAALWAVGYLGWDRISVHVRGAVRPECAGLAHRLGVRLDVKDLGGVSGPLVVSTLPSGVDAPAMDGVDVLFDATYDAWPTAVARAATAAGATSLPGTRLLLAQAAPQFALMTGHEAPLEVMHDAMALAGAPW